MTKRVQVGERFEVRGVLGEGGMGTVYRALDLSTGQEVALKVLQDRPSNEAERLLFKQEYRALSRLRHPNLCAVYDYGVTADGQPFFTMELVPGQDLHDMIPMPAENLLALLPQLGRALSYLHHHRLVHGDVKPENVRVTPDGTVKLMDLSFVRPAGEWTAVPGGTLSYMAPEVIRRDRVDQRADLYALGVSCYHVLVGRTPFVGGSPRDILRAHLTRRPRPLREVDPAIPPAVERFVGKLMASEPAARFASIAEALATLGLETEADSTSLLEGSFVGRESHLDAFDEALGQLLRHQTGGSLWLTGPPGCGKTRLLEAMRVHAQLEDVPFLYAPTGEAGAPYGPFVSLVRGLLAGSRGLAEGLTPEQRQALGRLLPELGPGGEAAQLEPREERALIQGGIAAVLRGVSAGGHGMVVAFDDWDRADAASVETLAYVRRNMRGIPLLVVGTLRDATRADSQVLPVPPLSAPELTKLAASILGSPDVPADVAAALLRWTGGHAAHVPWVVGHLVQTGALRRTPDGWHAAPGVAAGDLGADLGELALAPLASLSPAAMKVAEVATVIGPDADVRVVADLGGLDEESFLAALEELRAAHVVVIRERHLTVATEGLADALYQRIPEKRRVLLHAAVASYLETRLGTAAADHVTTRAALARHLLRSRQLRKALPAALIAADLDMAIFATDSARALLSDGLAAMAAEPDKHDRMQRDYLTRLAYVERWRGDLDAMRACLDRAMPLAEALGEPEPLARVLVHRATYHLQRLTPGDLQASLDVLGRAAELSTGGDGEIAVRVHFAQGQTLFYMGRAADARVAFEETARIAKKPNLIFWRAKSLAFLGYLQATGEPAYREHGFTRMAEADAIQGRLGDLYGRGYTAALRGDALLQALRLGEAEGVFYQQIAIAQELGARDDQITGMANLASVFVLGGGYHEALEVCADGLPLAQQHGHPVAVLARAVEACALAGVGELRKAEEALGAAEEAGLKAGSYMYTHAVPFILDGWLRLGRGAETRRIGDAAIALMASHPDPALLAQIRALVATAHLRLGDAETARGLAHKALEEAERIDAPLARLLGLRVQSQLTLRVGQLDDARRLGSRLLELAEGAGARAVAADAALLLGEAALRSGTGDAAVRFRAAQAFADREGVPLIRAFALFGQSEAETTAERRTAFAMEAREILRSLADNLKTSTRRAFLDWPDVARALEARMPAREQLSLESGPAVFDKIKAVSRDLLGFADQYGLLFREWIESTRRLEMLNTLARRINETLELDEVLQLVSAMTLELTVAERAFVLLADAEGAGGLVCRAAADRTGGTPTDQRVSRTVCRRVLAEGSALCVLDANENEELRTQSSIASLDLRTLMCVPLTARGQTLGVLYVDSQAVVTTFTRSDLELLQAIASHASVAIANATLYQASRQHSTELSKALAMYRDAMHQANTDVLTGLANRRCFEELAAREIDATRRYGRYLSVILLDVDRFKQFNDTFGHALGDEVLKVVAQVLASSVRVCDVAARLGGEEFVVLCPETSPEVAVTLAERIRRAVAARELTDAEGQPLRQITVSLGIAPFLFEDQDIAAALERADQALYRCKRDGRNRHHVWQKDEESAPSVGVN